MGITLDGTGPILRSNSSSYNDYLKQKYYGGGGRGSAGSGASQRNGSGTTASISEGLPFPSAPPSLQGTTSLPSTPDIQLDFQKYLSPGTVYGGVANGTTMAMKSMFEWSLRHQNSLQGYQNLLMNYHSPQKALDMVSDSIIITQNDLKTVGKLSTVTTMIGIGLDVGVGAYENVQNGAAEDKIVSDAIVDAAVSGGSSVLFAAAAGALAGSAIPGLGTIVGLMGGVLIYTLTDVIEVGGMSLRDAVKIGYYSSWQGLVDQVMSGNHPALDGYTR